MKLDGTVLGFDVGARRIGVAVGSAYGSGARALAVIDVHAHGPDWNAIDRLRAEWRPDGLVVGDPMTMDGGDQPIRRRAHAFARDASPKTRAYPSTSMRPVKERMPFSGVWGLFRARTRSGARRRRGRFRPSHARARHGDQPVRGATAAGRW